jgi:arylsulfatase A-like enzyme
MNAYTFAPIYAAVLFSVTGTSLMAAEQPNILFMMSDDQAWNGLSVPMHPAIPWSKSSIVETPNLEKLAAQGMRFSAAYAPASVCSPTRISLQTGKSPAALHWTKAAGPEAGHKAH